MLKLSVLSGLLGKQRRCLNKKSVLEGHSLSVVVAWLVEPNVVFSVDHEVTSVDVVSLENHFKYFWLVDDALLHEVDDFILNNDRMINVVVELNLHLVLQLACLVHEIFVLSWLCKFFVVLSKEVELTNVSPRVESVSHWVLSVEPHILASSEKEDFVNFSLQMLPVENVWHPRQ